MQQEFLLLSIVSRPTASARRIPGKGTAARPRQCVGIGAFAPVLKFHNVPSSHPRSFHLANNQLLSCKWDRFQVQHTAYTRQSQQQYLDLVWLSISWPFEEAHLQDKTALWVGTLCLIECQG